MASSNGRPSTPTPHSSPQSFANTSMAVQSTEWEQVLDKIENELRKSAPFKRFFKDKANRLKLCLKNATVERMIQEHIEKSKYEIKDRSGGQKNAFKATSLRLEGNEALAKEEYIKAYELYTRALMFASEDEEVSLLYAFRSVSSFHLKQFENAIDDTDRALRLGYSRYHDVDKLLLCKAECLLALGREEESREILEQAKKKNVSADGAIEANHFNQPEENLKTEHSKSMKRTVNLSTFQDIPSISATLTTKGVFSPHPRFTWLNTKVDLRRDSKKGFSLVSEEKLNYGEVVALGKPFLCLDSKDESTERCHYCLAPCFKSVDEILPKDNLKSTLTHPLSPDSIRMASPVACGKCSNVLYCSESCRSTAWSAFHRYECRQMALLSTLPGQAHLALRMLYTTRDIETLSQNGKNWKKNPAKVMTDQSTYTFSRIMPVPKLTTESIELRQTLTAVFLVKLARLSGYLQNDSDESILVGDLLCYHLGQLMRNDCIQTQNSFDDSPTSLFAIYSLAGLMQHSCEPTVEACSLFGNSLQSNVKLYYATRTILPGTTLTLGYSCPPMKCLEESLSERRSYLMTHYGFLCKCTRCEREARDRLNPVGDAYYPIACTSCGSLMVRSVTAKDVTLYGCLSEKCSVKLPSYKMKQHYDRLEKVLTLERNMPIEIESTKNSFQDRLVLTNQLKSAFDSTSTLLYRRSPFTSQLYARMMCHHFLLLMTPILDADADSSQKASTSKDVSVPVCPPFKHLLTFCEYAEETIIVLEQMAADSHSKVDMDVVHFLSIFFNGGDVLKLKSLYQADSLMSDYLASIIPRFRKRCKDLLKKIQFDAAIIQAVK